MRLFGQVVQIPIAAMDCLAPTDPTDGFRIRLVVIRRHTQRTSPRHFQQTFSKGRVIASLGAGWFEPEYRAYNLHFIEDPLERMAYARETVHVMRELWTHPAPERVTYEGTQVQVRDLPFSPAPYQKPHPPIWIGGDSDPILGMVKEYASGWVMARSGNPETLSRVMSAPDWPQREMTLVSSLRIFVADSHEEAVAEGTALFEATVAAAGTTSLEAYLTRSILGTPEECMAKIAEVESWGINYLRFIARNSAAQERVARMILPRLADGR